MMFWSIRILSVAACLYCVAGCTLCRQPKHDRPEVLFLGPIHRNAVLLDEIYSYLVENGVYVDVDPATGKLPDALPADLSSYKVIIVDRDLPIMQDENARQRLDEFAAQGGGVIYHKRPETINWNSNEPELYEVFDAVTKKCGARTQHPAFLQRNASRPDRDVILTCAVDQTTNPDWQKWYIIGNDVAYMHFEGLLKTADLYQRDDLRRFVLGMLERILKEKGENVPVFGGHLLIEFRQPGFEKYLEITLKRRGVNPGAAPARPPAQPAAAAQPASRSTRGFNGESLQGLAVLAQLGALYNQPQNFQTAVDRLKEGHAALVDRQTHLWAHGARADGQRGFPWGRGEGWMLIGPAGMAEYMPRDHAGYPVLVQYMKELAEALCHYQDADTGLWHNIIDDPSTRLEASGTAMILNAYCRAYRVGVCRTPEVKEMLTKAWWGLKAHTVGPRTYSFLWGQGVSYNKDDYARKPSSGAVYLAPLAGPEYVKTFGPLVP
jgi:hypothetical protein